MVEGLAYPSYYRRAYASPGRASGMREFLVVAHEAPTDPAFSLDNLAGAGRLDLLCRCVSAALFTSHAIRTDTRVHLVIQDAVTISIDGKTVRNARPDERSLAGLLQTALESVSEAIGHQPTEPAPGIRVRTRGFDATLQDRGRSRTILVLAEDGTPIVDSPVPADPLFVLSDHRNFTDSDRDVLTDHADDRVRLGPESLHANHATSIAHNWLDTEGFQQY